MQDAIIAGTGNSRVLKTAPGALVGLGAAATPNDMFSALARTLNGKIENGSYVGTVTPEIPTPASTREIYCTGIPRALFLVGNNTWYKGNAAYDGPILLISIGVPGMTISTRIYPVNSGNNIDSDYSDAIKYATFSDGKISLYHLRSYFNRAGTTYYYTILK